MLPNKSAGAEQNRLFLAVLQGDSSGLQRDFELALSGDAQHWKLTLTPRSLLLKQVFTQINITVANWCRHRTAGNPGRQHRAAHAGQHRAQPLSDAEQHDFAE
jgi:hypothetical protein